VEDYTLFKVSVDTNEKLGQVLWGRTRLLHMLSENSSSKNIINRHMCSEACMQPKNLKPPNTAPTQGIKCVV